MRQAGKLPSEQEARRFVDYLLTKKMPAKAEAVNGEFAIWINEEDQFQEARRELEAFRAEPQHERYKAAARQAETLRNERTKREAEARKRVTSMSNQWDKSTSAAKPLTMALIVISVVVSMLSSFSDTGSVITQTLMFANPLHFEAIPDGGLDPSTLENKLIDIRGGQVWRLITPMFLHGDPLHIAFNMLLMYQLGGLIEPRIGTPRYGLLVLVTGVASMTLTSVMPFRLVLPIVFGNNGPFVIGMSGVVFGLIGYMWGRSLTQPLFGMMIRPTIYMFAVAYIAVGVSGILEQFGMHISNWGHLLGLVFGLGLAFAESAFPKK